MSKDCLIKEAVGRVIYFAFLLLVFSCQSKLNKSFALAGDNRMELEKVLDYFKDDPEPLKYESAKYLIENIPSHCFMSGPAVDMLDSIYISACGESQNNRTQYYNTSSLKVNMSQAKLTYDICAMKSDYLIKMINEACDTWIKTSWHEKYDKSLFFEYVLPYRLLHEPISNWRKSVKYTFPLLEQEKVLSRRGMQFEAENAHYQGCDIKEYKGASNGQAVMMTDKESSISVTIESGRQTEKRLILKYSAIAHQLTAILSVNGAIEDTLHLAPTRNLDSFSEKWFFISLPLNKGKNIISIHCPTDTLCVDYIQLGAIEEFKHDDLIDFSNNYYTIINKESNNCISFDTASFSKVNIIQLKPYSPIDSSLLVRLDYAGYPLWKIGYYKNEYLDLCLGIEFGTPYTLSSGTSVKSDKYIMRPFNQWLFIPLGNSYYRIMNKHTGMFLDIAKDATTGHEVLVQKSYEDHDSQKWLLQKRVENTMRDKTFIINSALSEAMRVLDMTHQFEYYIYGNTYGTKGSSLIKTMSGKCADETCFTVYLCRYLGIPSAYDFTPHWGNRSSSHSWSVLLDEKGNSIPFYMGNSPGDTAHYFHSYIKPKVYRYRYSLNDQIVADMREELSIPVLFKEPHYTDVTDEYCKTVDVERLVPQQYKDRKVAYICVFDNQDWVPVHYGMVHKNKALFTSMGCGIVYMLGFYDDGEIVPFGVPFLIDADGKVRDLSINKNKTVNMELLRKYPFMGAQDYFNSRMNGGQFQGSNKPDFSDASVLHVHKGITNGNWYNIPVLTDKKFKFLRYIGGKGSFCNINELEFYGFNGQKIEGKIIGTEGESWARKENVFDGNILTGFGGICPDGNWVGLKLNKPMQVSRIKYIGRNDGNCIEVGDTYELYFWNKDSWELVGSQRATSSKLCFHNVPSDGLYILKDITKGLEERIFTYENGKQVWW